MRKAESTKKPIGVSTKCVSVAKRRKHEVPPALRFADSSRDDDTMDTLFLKPIGVLTKYVPVTKKENTGSLRLSASRTALGMTIRWK